MPDNSIPVIDHPLAPEIFAGGSACFGLIGTTAVASVSGRVILPDYGL
jgi:hypothetical protein